MKRTLAERFDIFNQKNPQVYDLFKQFTFMAIDRGHTKLSAWMIANRIRWESEIETIGEDYKVSNDFIALYARKFMEDHPQHDGFFKTKKMTRA